MFDMNDPFLNTVAFAAGLVVGWLMFLKPLLGILADREKRRQRIEDAIKRAWVEAPAAGKK